MSQWGSRLHPRIALGLLHPGGDSAQLARAKQAPPSPAPPARHWGWTGEEGGSTPPWAPMSPSVESP